MERLDRGAWGDEDVGWSVVAACSSKVNGLDLDHGRTEGQGSVSCDDVPDGIVT